jgi:hypothetical protein
MSGKNGAIAEGRRRVLASGHVDYEGASPLALHGHRHHPFAGSAEKKEAVIAGNARDCWLAPNCSDEIPRSLKFLGSGGVPGEGDFPLGPVPEAKPGAVPTAPTAERHGRA